MAKYTWTSVVSGTTKINAGLIEQLINNYNTLCSDIGNTDPGNKVSGITAPTSKTKADSSAIAKLYIGLNNAYDVVACATDNATNKTANHVSNCVSNKSHCAAEVAANYKTNTNTSYYDYDWMEDCNDYYEEDCPNVH